MLNFIYVLAYCILFINYIICIITNQVLVLGDSAINERMTGERIRGGWKFNRPSI